MYIQPQDLRDYLETLPRSGIHVVWVEVTAPRDDFATSLESLVTDSPVLTIVVRSRGFDDANSILADFIGVLNDSRSYCENRLGSFCHAEYLYVVLLAKKRLNVPQASSPVTMPHWLPLMPGATVEAIVRDVTWTVEMSLNDSRVAVDRIQEALYLLEESMIRRMKSTVSVDSRLGSSLISQLDDPPTLNFADCVREFDESHKAVINATAFRPSLRASSSLVGHLWRLVQRTSIDGLGKPAEALSRALGVPEEAAERWSVGYVGLLFRQSNPPSALRKLGLDLVATTGLACQLTTAAAHADSYPRFSVPLVVSFSGEILNTLSRAVSLLDSLD